MKLFIVIAIAFFALAPSQAFLIVEETSHGSVVSAANHSLLWSVGEDVADGALFHFQQVGNTLLYTLTTSSGSATKTIALGQSDLPSEIFIEFSKIGADPHDFRGTVSISSGGGDSYNQAFSNDGKIAWRVGAGSSSFEDVYVRATFQGALDGRVDVAAISVPEPVNIALGIFGVVVVPFLLIPLSLWRRWRSKQ